MATPGRTEKRLSGRHADFRPRARPCVGAGGFAKRSLSPPMGWQRGRARRGDDAVPRAGRLPDPRTAMSIHGHMMVPSPGGADVSGSMRSLLRASTMELHAAVDSRFAPMLDAGEAGYRSFLLASAAAVFPLEQSLLAAGVGALLPDWTRRTRAAALRADLTDLGITDVAAATAPPLAGAARMFGALYVLEGSRLGQAAGPRSARGRQHAGSGRHALPASRGRSPVVAIIPDTSGILAGRAGMPRRGHRRRKTGVRLVHRRASRSRAPRPSGRGRDRRCRLTTARPST